MLSGATDDDAIQARAEEFYTADFGTTWQENRNQCNADALISFLDIVDGLDLEECNLRRGQQQPPKLLIKGVAVSVRPELVLTKQNRSGDLVEGAIKLYINKNHTLSKEAGEYAATLLHQFADTYPCAGGTCDYRLCYVVDVFGQRIFTAPRSYKQRRKSIAASCEEIKRAWSDL